MYSQCNSLVGCPSSIHNPKLLSQAKYPLRYGPLSLSKEKLLELSVAQYKPKHRHYPLRIHASQKYELVETAKEDVQVEIQKDFKSYRIEELLNSIKSLLSAMDEGILNISPYDTAWIALIEDSKEKGKPQFSCCLQWIVDNQLDDGSWGDRFFFSAYDRLLHTLACVIALKTWNIHSEKVERGVSFIQDNICKLEMESEENMTAGFEVLLPSLIERAKRLGIEIQDDSPVLQEIYARRNFKLQKIPMDVLHSEYTTLLHSAEAMEGLDWEKILKLKSSDGSILYSPAATAFAYLHSQDEKCLEYIKHVVDVHDGGVPHTFPNDLLTRMWAVDRLQRLGISHHFQGEIDKILNYVYRHWSESGIYVARDSPVVDIDDTAMGFRLLRLQGYDISSDVFWVFKEGDRFCCFPRQTTEAVSPMFNLYRASQVSFPGEKALEETKAFSYKFLQEKRASNQFHDKWVIPKDLPGEVGYALDVPWYASLPRVESRFYIEQYGGEDDIWIAKTFYRMPEVNNAAYLELAKLDYNNCQELHQKEWDNMKEWYTQNNLWDYSISERKLLDAYFLAAASIFEPERSNERLAWAKSKVLIEMLPSFFNKDNDAVSIEDRRVFLEEFTSAISMPESINGYRIKSRIVGIILSTLIGISSGVLTKHGRYILHDLYHSWEMWLKKSSEETLDGQIHAELLVQTICLCSGHLVSSDIFSHQAYKRLSNLTNQICHQLSQFQASKISSNDIGNETAGNIIAEQVNPNMQELVHLVLNNSSDDIDGEIKKIFLALSKTYYYSAYCDPRTISMHISKVLFQRII